MRRVLGWIGFCLCLAVCILGFSFELGISAVGGALLSHISLPTTVPFSARWLFERTWPLVFGLAAIQTLRSTEQPAAGFAEWWQPPSLGLRSSRPGLAAMVLGLGLYQAAIFLSNWLSVAAASFSDWVSLGLYVGMSISAWQVLVGGPRITQWFGILTAVLAIFLLAPFFWNPGHAAGSNEAGVVMLHLVALWVGIAAARTSWLELEPDRSTRWPAFFRLLVGSLLFVTCLDQIRLALGLFAAALKTSVALTLLAILALIAGLAAIQVARSLDRLGILRAAAAIPAPVHAPNAPGGATPAKAFAPLTVPMMVVLGFAMVAAMTWPVVFAIGYFLMYLVALSGMRN